jgi:hypothetical protein
MKNRHSLTSQSNSSISNRDATPLNHHKELVDLEAKIALHERVLFLATEPGNGLGGEQNNAERRISRTNSTICKSLFDGIRVYLGMSIPEQSKTGTYLMQVTRQIFFSPQSATQQVSLRDDFSLGLYGECFKACSQKKKTVDQSEKMAVLAEGTKAALLQLHRLTVIYIFI